MLLLALEFGTGFVSHLPRHNVADSANGLDLRVNIEHWSVGLGVVPERKFSVDDWVETPVGIDRIGQVPGYTYLSLDRRFYTKHRRFWAAFGFMFRDVETCLINGGRCYDGAPEVSERLCFHPGFGFRWRRIELAYEHCSTADIAAVNQGEDTLRFSFFWRL